jgi:hypothetical protein
VHYRLPNGFRSGSADFRVRIRYLGWVGLEPTTNALKGRCSTIELPTRLEKSHQTIANFALCKCHSIFCDTVLTNDTGCPNKTRNQSHSLTGCTAARFRSVRRALVFLSLEITPSRSSRRRCGCESIRSSLLRFCTNRCVCLHLPLPQCFGPGLQQKRGGRTPSP